MVCVMSTYGIAFSALGHCIIAVIIEWMFFFFFFSSHYILVQYSRPVLSLLSPSLVFILHGRCFIYCFRSFPLAQYQSDFFLPLFSI